MNRNVDILVTLSTFGEYSKEPIQILDQSGFTFQMNESGRRMKPNEVAELGSNCSGLIAGVENYSVETLSLMPGLKCISRCGAGIDNIDLTEARRLGIAVLNTPDEPTAAVAELTIAVVLSLLRRLPEVDALMHSRKWHRVPGNLLSDKVVGIIGLGRIGRRVAELIMAFGSTLIGSDPYPDDKWIQIHHIEIVELSELLRRSDIVVIHASNTSNHPLVLGGKELSRMKRGAWLINMARGDMVDDKALTRAIDSGHLNGAGLDVYPEEPYNGPLCDNDRIILSPHQATLTTETRIAMEVRAVENLVRYLHSLD